MHGMRSCVPHPVASALGILAPSKEYGYPALALVGTHQEAGADLVVPGVQSQFLGEVREMVTVILVGVACLAGGYFAAWFIHRKDV